MLWYIDLYNFSNILQFIAILILHATVSMFLDIKDAPELWRQYEITRFLWSLMYTHMKEAAGNR